MIRSLSDFALAAMRSLSAVLVALAVAFGPVRAQCLSYEVFPYEAPDIPVGIYTAISGDDGSGPAVYLGQFTVDASGSAVRRWDGQHLSTVGPGLRGHAKALAIFDSGSGPALYVGGLLYLSGPDTVLVARWNGANWQPIATTNGSNSVSVLRVHDDGSGPALFAAGNFTSLGPGLSAWGCARWNGTAWSAMGAGTNTRVDALESFDEGSGPRLFLGGDLRSPTGTSLGAIARWDGAVLTTVGSGLPPGAVAKTLRVFDDGTGPALHVVGTEPAQPNPNYTVTVAWNWRNQVWTSMPTVAGYGTYPGALAVADAGYGRQLLATTYENGVGIVRRFTGSSWVQVGEALRLPCGGNVPLAPTFLGELDFGTGPRLCMSPSYPVTTGTTYGATFVLAGGSWIVPGHLERGFDPTDRVQTLASFDDGSGPTLFVGGQFCRVDGLSSYAIARFRAGQWEPASLPGAGVQRAYTFAVSDLGGSSQLYVSGRFAYANGSTGYGLLRWDGASWSPQVSLTNGDRAAYAMATANLGGGARLYVGGSFQYADGLASPNFAAWNGATWSALPPGPSAGVNGTVYALAAHDDGSGTALYLGGSFTAQTMGLPLSRIARWNGTSFSTLGSGMNADVWALRAFDDGSGTKLYAAGAFTTAGGVPAQRIARFDGTAWSPVGAGFDALVTCLEVFDDGSGPALYAAGDFMASGATPVTHIARWDGSAWSALGNGVGPAVYALASHAESPGEPAKLFVGGNLQTAGTLATSNLAAWRACGGTIDRFCFGDGTSSPCPCDNSSLASRGCNNSAGSGGARLNATGATNPDTIALYVAGETPNAATLVIQGDVLLSNPQPFGDGLRCVSGSLKRMYTTNAISGSLAVPGIGQPSVSARSAQLGDVLAPGSVRGYQAWYRDVNPSFCAPPDGANWNLSNGVRIVW